MSLWLPERRLLMPFGAARGAVAKSPGGGEGPEPFALQGFGGGVTGGVGGTVYPVTITDDSGAGSLRQAITDANNDAGPAIVDIQVGGYFTSNSMISVTGADITITAANAPSIASIRANQSSQWGDPLLNFNGCDNVLVEHVRLPRGLSADNDTNGKCASFTEATNIAFRFCSLSWADDELATFWTNSQNITFQYCTLHEALYNAHHDEGGLIAHSMCSIIGGGTTTVPIRLTYDKCVFAHCNGRMPWRCQRPEMEVINCIVYNWRQDPTNWRGAEWVDDADANIEGTIFISGPDEASGNVPFRNFSSPVFAADLLWIKKDGSETTTLTEISGGDTLQGTPRTYSPAPAVAVTRLAKEDVWAHVKPLVGATEPARSHSDARILSHIENAITKVSLDGSMIDNPADEDTNNNPSATRTAYATWAEAIAPE